MRAAWAARRLLSVGGGAEGVADEGHEASLGLPAVPTQPLSAAAKAKAKPKAAQAEDAELAELAAWVNN